jgi:signal transduction histidine kinase
MIVFAQTIATADDVFSIRQRGRQVAAVAGFDVADQVRLATALSELGRDVLATPGGGDASFEIDTERAALVVTVRGLGRGAIESGVGLPAARRLMTSVEVAAGNADLCEVIMTRRLPAPTTPGDAADMRARLAALVVSSPLDELRAQNRELIAALEELTERHGEVLQLNNELEETNRGVMAMYTQLSEELEATNRGVVALYAELDEKSARLQAATEAKSRFLNSVSHELRSPVNSMLGLSRLLLAPDSAPLDGDQSRQVRLLERAGSELLELVNQLLDLARAESGRLEASIARADLGRLVADVAAGLEPLVVPGVELLLDAPPTQVMIDTDSTLVRQIIRNLIANALAFTPEGRVVVSVRVEGDVAIVDVADSGIGIAPQHLDEVFEEFFQVRGPLQNRRKGSGLGLAYSRKVADLLGGSLTLDSQIGAGSTFTLLLPGVVVREVVVAARPLHVVPGSGRTLIVDDDAGFRAILAGLLRPLSTEVHEAENGAAALAALRARSFDLVTLDLLMPVMDGATLLRAMADDASLRDVPVLVFTSADLAAAGKAAGHARAIVDKRELTAERLQHVLADIAALDARR